MQNKIIRTGKSVTLNFKFEVLPSFYTVWISRTEMWSAGDMSWQTHGTVLPPCWAQFLWRYTILPMHECASTAKQVQDWGPCRCMFWETALGAVCGCGTCPGLGSSPIIPGSLPASCYSLEWLRSFAVPHPLPGDLARVTEASKTGSLLPLSQVEQRSPP